MPLLFLCILLESTINSLLLHLLLALITKLACLHTRLPKTYYITQVFDKNFLKCGVTDARAFSVSLGKACFKIRVLSNKICPHIVHWNMRFKIPFPCSRSSVLWFCRAMRKHKINSCLSGLQGNLSQIIPCLPRWSPSIDKPSASIFFKQNLDFRRQSALADLPQVWDVVPYSPKATISF